MITQNKWTLTDGDTLDEYIAIGTANGKDYHKVLVWEPQECADCGAPTSQGMEWCSNCTQAFFENVAGPQCSFCHKKLALEEYEAFGGMCVRCDHVYNEHVLDMMQELTYDE
jgi:predicted amidophosphoribosyltransferase